MADESLLAIAIETYRKSFGRNPDTAAFAPGRVNLIGEHTDYNDGFVLPFALPLQTVVVGSKVTGPDSSLISCSMKDADPVMFQVNSSLCKGEPTWANYVKGTVFQYLGNLPDGFAFNAVVMSNVPIGSGLSSSASLEVATATLLEALCGIICVTGVEKAIRCQTAEHTFVGTPCGIMDQFISSMGQPGQLLLIDCRIQDYTLIPFGTGNNSPVVVVTNSNVKHELSGSEYPDRVKQCKEAVRILQGRYPEIKALRDCADMKMLDSVKGLMSTRVYNRARHCVTEDRRTLSAVDALTAGDFKKVGKLMTESHESLRDDYEVSCVELDALVASALELNGVYGSRMTGGGFGGCTVTLVEKAVVDQLIAHLKEEYKQKFNCDCICYVAEPSSGARVIDLKTVIKKVDAEVMGNGSNCNLTPQPRSAIVDWVLPSLVVALAVIVAIKLIRNNNN